VRAAGAYLPQAADGRTRQDIEVYYHEVVQVAQEAASTGEPTARSDGFIFVQPYSSPPKVVLAPFADTTGRPFLGDQIAAGNCRVSRSVAESHDEWRTRGGSAMKGETRRSASRNRLIAFSGE
jgi:hypothetical protein